MTGILSATVFLFCLVAQSENSEEIENRTIKNLKKSIEYSTKKQLPLQIPEKYYAKLNIAIPICEESNLREKMLSCTYFKCFKKNTVGDAVMYSEVIVHGFNNNKNCALSYRYLRYFVPSADLKVFIPLFDQSSKLHDPAIKAFYLNKGKTNTIKVVFEIPDDGKICKINAVYQIDLDTANAIVSKAPPNHKIEGIEKITSNNSVSSYYEYNKVIYSPKNKTFNFIPRLLSYELHPASALACKQSKAALLLFDLEKKRYIRESSEI